MRDDGEGEQREGVLCVGVRHAPVGGVAGRDVRRGVGAGEKECEGEGEEEREGPERDAEH